MTTPNIEMIADSLRNCSLNSRRLGIRSSPVRSPPSPENNEEEEVTVELNSDVALPRDWEQCLDMRTGKIYYRNWRSGERTTEDPRPSNDSYSSSSCNEDDSSNDEDDTSDSSNQRGGDRYFSSCDFSSSGDSSSYSAYSLEVTSAEPQVLVAAGCKFCFMYFMVPKRDFSCPKCGRLLIHLG